MMDRAGMSNDEIGEVPRRSAGARNLPTVWFSPSQI